jgi:SAM-dependent methyltransferase
MTELDYRASHARPGYGSHYSQTYKQGYYADLWKGIERPFLEDLFERMRAEGRESCLDFACGTGRITQVAERYFDPCLGVDISDEMLKIARASCQKAILEQRDITRNPLPRKFDVITSFRFFLNAQPALRVAALRALTAMLEANGRMIINVHVNRSSPLGVAYRVRNRLAGREMVHHYGFYPRTGWHLEWLQRALMQPTERIFEKWTWLPRSWAQSFVVTCTRASQRR